MKFTKYNNPNKRRIRRTPRHSDQHVSELRNEMYTLLANASSESERDSIIKAYGITTNPLR